MTSHTSPLIPTFGPNPLQIKRLDGMQAPSNGLDTQKSFETLMMHTATARLALLLSEMADDVEVVRRYTCLRAHTAFEQINV